MSDVPIDRRPWRQRWPKQRCMKIQLRDERGGEVGIEAKLSEAQYADLLRICLGIVKEHAQNMSPPAAAPRET